MNIFNIVILGGMFVLVLTACAMGCTESSRTYVHPAVRGFGVFLVVTLALVGGVIGARVDIVLDLMKQCRAGYADRDAQCAVDVTVGTRDDGMPLLVFTNARKIDP